MCDLMNWKSLTFSGSTPKLACDFGIEGFSSPVNVFISTLGNFTITTSCFFSLCIGSLFCSIDVQCLVIIVAGE